MKKWRVVNIRPDDAAQNFDVVFVAVFGIFVYRSFKDVWECSGFKVVVVNQDDGLNKYLENWKVGSEQADAVWFGQVAQLAVLEDKILLISMFKNPFFWWSG